MEEKKLKSIIKLLALIAIILLIDIIGGYFIGKKLLIPKVYNTDIVMKTDDSSDSGNDNEKQMPGLLKELESINLNPSGSSGEIFSCQLILESKDQKVINELTVREPQIKDIVLIYLSFKSVQELNDVSQRKIFRKDLITIINSVLTNGEISNLYITQWILQFN